MQEALFYEKQNLIEKSLFGVDINPKSVMICRLRLWIELLKNSYYTEKSKYEHLETLPNIDINIKCGNSLISRFAIDDNNSMLPKDRPYIATLIEKYKILVDGYKNALDKKAKDDYRRQIAYSKTEFEKFTLPNDKDYIELKKKEGELMQTVMVFDRKETERLKKIAEEVAGLKKLYLEKLQTIYGNSFEWRFEFPEVLNDEGQFHGFDVVIGNPPYFSLSTVDRNQQDYFAASYNTFSKGSDIYCLFYERGISSLNKNGMLCYITSNSWLRTQYGKLLRDYFLNETNPKILVNIENTQIFEEATVETNILIIQNADWNHSLSAANLKSDYSIEKSLQEYVAINAVEVKELKSEGWIIGSEAENILKKKIETNSKLLKELDTTISYGIKTGYNEAFIIDEETKKRLIKEDPGSARLIYPILRGRDIKAYHSNFAGLWIIYIPKGFTIKTSKQDENQYILNEPSPRYGTMDFDDAWDWFKRNYPAIAAHVLPFKSKAKVRFDKGDFWWEQRACAYLDDFYKPKIIWGELSDEQKFAFDAEGYYLNNTIFFLTGKYLKYLLAILNSKLSKWYFNQISTTTGMGTNRWLKYKIEQLPIKEISEKEQLPFVNLADKILAAKSKNLFADTRDLEKKIDEMVYTLYNLTEEEIKIVANA